MILQVLYSKLSIEGVGESGVVLSASVASNSFCHCSELRTHPLLHHRAICIAAGKVHDKALLV